ncbi:CdaR family protein [Pseudogracilibacillus sp. SE30717A]|uniref:CdaR family protein n=1 Tax=Pseudogracilibacillus sp. SE30717A TaxID=3098293 RepID=UPI00300E44C8
MDKLFQSKWFIRVISLVFAVTLYLFVTVETDTAQNESRVIPGISNEVQVLEDVPLDIRIDADQYVVSGVPEHVKVSLEGKTSVLTPIVRQRNFSVFVDLRDLGEGEHTVEIEYENIPEELTAYIEPKTIDVNIEKRAAKEFNVSVDLVNTDSLPIGYELGEPEISPGTVTIISSESVIEQIAMVKVFVDVTDLKESIRNREVPISVYDIQGNDLNVRVEPASVTVSVPVERPSKTVPLTIKTKGELPEGLKLEKLEAEQEIEVFGKREILSQIKEITTKEIDLSKIEKSDMYEIDLDFPEGIIANDDMVEVNILLSETKLFEDIPIEQEGDNSGNLTITKPKEPLVNIIARGSDTDIGALKKEDIKAIIDIGALDEGEHKIELVVNGPDNVTLEPEFKNVTVKVE